MGAYGTGILRRWACRLWPTTRTRAVILVYHRIASLPSDPQLLCVKPEHFAQHLEHICHAYRPMSLVELGRSLANGQLPHHAIAVTFDDGYVDNLRNAKPILERYNVPATVFVTSGYVGQNREFWWDELEHLLLLPAKLPDRLELTISGRAYSWLTSSEPISGNDTEANRAWNVLMKSYPTPRHRAYTELHRLLRPLSIEEREKIMTEVERWAGAKSGVRPDYRALNPDEMKQLSEGDLVDIGSHTVTHPMLSTEPTDYQRREIFQSKQDLEGILNRTVTSFSYPYGNRREDSAPTIELVREAGYELACANFPAVATRRSDTFWLPRFLVRDWAGEDFAQRLRRWFHE